MKVVLIPCGDTEWRAEGRLLGRVELPLTAEGELRCRDWIDMLRANGVQRILHSPDELATQTAGLVGDPLGVPIKSIDGLAEVDVGLWAGLTEKDLKARYASAHRELGEAPLNVKPPRGESLGDAAARVKHCLRKRIRANGKAAVALVMRPFSLGLARCALEGRDPAKLWDEAQAITEPVVIEWHGKPATADA